MPDRGEPDDQTRHRDAGRADADAADDATQRRSVGEHLSNAALDPLLALGGASASGDDATRAREPGIRAPADRGRAGPVEVGAIIRRRYVLERLIGSGGMGQVWQAKDGNRVEAGDPNPYVALKLLNDDFAADPAGLVSLQRESRKAQELAHPNVSTVYDFDIDRGGSGRAFMSMELLHGSTLDAVIRTHPDGMPRAAASPLIIGMARGLEYAHKKGLVHSDFKPGNVFLTEAGVPKVLDFGIARAAKIAGVDRQEDSFDAGSLGGLTLVYASAEMIERLEPHPADDVYALGLVAYELLTGRHPFQRRPATEARDARKPPARIRSIRRYEWQAIARALEFDRTKRWQNAGDFLRAYEGKSIAAKVLGVLALCLALTAGAFWYEAGKAKGPDVPFESLPAEVQSEFRQHMSTADGAWRLVQQGMGDESLDAASEYGKAYALHVRNPDATAGLRKAADYRIKQLQGVADREERLQALKSFEQLSDFYSGYPPLLDAIGAAGSK